MPADHANVLMDRRRLGGWGGVVSTPAVSGETPAVHDDLSARISVCGFF